MKNKDLYKLVEGTTEEEAEALFNLSSVVCNKGKANLSFSIEPFQKGNMVWKNELEEIKFDLFFEEDVRVSGVIDEMYVQIRTRDKKEALYKMDEFEPEQLYFIGKALLGLAKYFGIDKQEILKINKDKLNKLGVK